MSWLATQRHHGRTWRAGLGARRAFIFVDRVGAADDELLPHDERIHGLAWRPHRRALFAFGIVGCSRRRRPVWTQRKQKHVRDSRGVVGWGWLCALVFSSRSHLFVYLFSREQRRTSPVVCVGRIALFLLSASSPASAAAARHHPCCRSCCRSCCRHRRHVVSTTTTATTEARRA